MQALTRSGGLVCSSEFVPHSSSRSRRPAAADASAGRRDLLLGVRASLLVETRRSAAADASALPPRL